MALSTKDREQALLSLPWLLSIMRHRPKAVLCVGVADGIVELLGKSNRLRLMKVGLVLPALIAFALLIFTSPIGAQELPARDLLPDKPVPQGNFFTRPFYDKSVRILAVIDAGSATWDDIASHKVVESGGYERNPLMRPFVHTSGILAAETVGEVWAVAFVADRMKHSHHAILRKTWWLPQALNIAAKIYGGINSTVQLVR